MGVKNINLGFLQDHQNCLAILYNAASPLLEKKKISIVPLLRSTFICIRKYYAKLEQGTPKLFFYNSFYNIINLGWAYGNKTMYI